MEASELQQMSQGRENLIEQHRRDFNQAPEGYRPPRFQREEIEPNYIMEGGYQNSVVALGECCGRFKTCCPCLCVQYPYITIEQGYKGIIQRFGRYYKTVEPGYTYFNICADRLIQIDMKIQVIDLSRQQIITKDNIMVIVDAAVYYKSNFHHQYSPIKVINPLKSQYSVDSIYQAVMELSLSSLRSIIGQYTLQNVLEKRQEITEQLQRFVDQHSWEWGVDIDKVLVKDINISPELQDVLSAVAKEQRNAQSKIINAKADVESAKIMRQAATLLDSKAAMQIRYLETVSQIGRSGNAKVILLPDLKRKEIS